METPTTETQTTQPVLLVAKRFEELTDGQKERAVEYALSNNMFPVEPEFITDNEYLLEPHETILKEKFGERYTGVDNSLIVLCKGNKIYWDLRQGKLNFTEAIDVIDNRMFLEYLGLPEHLLDRVGFWFETGAGYVDRSDCTVIKLEMNHIDQEYDENGWAVISPEDQAALEAVAEAFDDYRDDVLKRIKDEIDYMESADYIEGRLEEHDFLFADKQELDDVDSGIIVLE